MSPDTNRSEDCVLCLELRALSYSHSPFFGRFLAVCFSNSCSMGCDRPPDLRSLPPKYLPSIKDLRGTASLDSHSLPTFFLGWVGLPIRNANLPSSPPESSPTPRQYVRRPCPPPFSPLQVNLLMTTPRSPPLWSLGKWPAGLDDISSPLS